MAIGIFYGSNGGNTERVAKLIQESLGLESQLFDIGRAKKEDFEKFDKLILGTSTWGEGDLQDDWENFFEDFKNLDLCGKTVAFFGVGDQESYGENFLDGMGTLYECAVSNGASVVGDGWSAKGYDYEESTAVVDDAFVGLAIDEDNQDDLTLSRVSEWTGQIRSFFA